MFDLHVTMPRFGFVIPHFWVMRTRDGGVRLISKHRGGAISFNEEDIDLLNPDPRQYSFTRSGFSSCASKLDPKSSICHYP